MQTFLRERQRGLFAVMGVVTAAAMTVVTIGTLVITHRIAGPVYRLRKHLEKVADGAIDEDVGFRPRDQFPELATSCNRALQTVRRLRSGFRQRRG